MMNGRFGKDFSGNFSAQELPCKIYGLVIRVIFIEF